MLDALIRLSLRRRALVALLALTLIGGGLFELSQLPIDVLPDLNRPTVTLMTESPGLSPEEVELLVTRPIEQAMLGAPDIQRVRSTSGIGLSLVFLEFDWRSDLRAARQMVSERLLTLQGSLPRGIQPRMGPVTSIMGEILLLGLVSDDESLTPMQLRTLADWTLRPRLLTLPGIAQVIPIGGQVEQLQVLVDPNALAAWGLSFDDVARAAEQAQGASTGGFLESASQEYLVRNLARPREASAIADTPITLRDGIAVRLSQVASVTPGAAVRRGDAGVDGKPAVVLSVQKQPGASTIALDAQIQEQLEQLKPALPAGVRIVPLFRQATFIETAIDNVAEALRDGALLVIVVLVLFLLNARTTLITLTAIPMSMLVAVLVFSALGLSINTMTLGGLAVAMGELVDDAIVDVENVFRRLRESRQLQNPPHPLVVIYRASIEVRGSIVFATAVVVLVFVPLLALGGVEGRLFQPLAIGYIVAILASLLVSLTLTPVLCSVLLPQARATAHSADGPLVRVLKEGQRRILDSTIDESKKWMIGATGLVLLALLALPFLGRSFLPPFNEGTATVNLLTPSGTSLTESSRIGMLAEELIGAVPEVRSTGRRTGRAELDEHAEGVHYNEIDVDFLSAEELVHRGIEAREHGEVLADIRARLRSLVGTQASIGQPISHRLDHILSGVRAQVVVKFFGKDLVELRTVAAHAQEAMADIPGVVDLQVERQVLIPQVRIEVDRERAEGYGIRPGELTERLERALAGDVVSQILDGPRSIDIVVRFDESARRDLAALRRVLIETPSGARVPLQSLASVEEDVGPNQILHDDGARRIVVSCNVDSGDIGATVDEIQRVVLAMAKPPGVTVRFEGQHESQQSASRLLAFLSLAALIAIVVVLHVHLRSWRLVAQVVLNVPLALVGAVLSLWVFDLDMSLATIIGFITVCGIAARNSILLIDHTVHIIEQDGQPFGRASILQATQERLVPVLMTALTAGLALVPLAISGGQPGKEILHPVAVVILGGLLSSTVLDLLMTPALLLRFGAAALQERARTAGVNGDPLAPPTRDGSLV